MMSMLVSFTFNFNQKQTSYLGIIAYKLGIWPQHNENMRFWSGNPETDLFDHTIAAHGYSPKDLIQQNNRVNNHNMK